MRGVLGEGDLYGGISMLINNGIAVRSIRILENTYFYILPKEVFLRLCREHEVFAEYFTGSFGKKMMDRSYASIIRNHAGTSDTTQHSSSTCKWRTSITRIFLPAAKIPPSKTRRPS